MYYFKCSNCGYFNHIASEYLIFCGNCGKKLQITYRDWHVKNPDKNLNDFQALFCTTENEKDLIPGKVQKSNYKKLLFLILVIFFIFSALLMESLSIPAFFINNADKFEIQSEKWIVQKIGCISVETPFSLIDASSNIKNAIVEDFKSFAYTSAEGFEMLITCIKYNENVAERNLISISSDPINQMQSNTSLYKMELEKNYIKINGINGILYKGNYMRNSEKFEFIEATYAHKSNLWQLIIVFKPDNKWDKYKGYRILNSLNITK